MPRKIIDLTGRQFGRLCVLAQSQNRAGDPKARGGGKRARFHLWVGGCGFGQTQSLEAARLMVVKYAEARAWKDYLQAQGAMVAHKKAFDALHAKESADWRLRPFLKKPVSGRAKKRRA